MKIKINPNAQIPIYRQIVDQVKHLILSGQLSADQKLPSSRSLGVELKVNMLTVQKAYQELRNQNLIYNKRGEGSFVSHVDVETDSAMQLEEIKRQLRQTIRKAKIYGLLPQQILKTVEEVLAEGEHNES